MGRRYRQHGRRHPRGRTPQPGTLHRGRVFGGLLGDGNRRPNNWLAQSEPEQDGLMVSMLKGFAALVENGKIVATRSPGMGGGKFRRGGLFRSFWRS